MTGKPTYAELEQRVGLLEAELVRARSREEMPREGDQRYLSLFNQITEGVYLHDLEGRILDVNPMACRQLGYSREELLALNVFDLFPPHENGINLPRAEVLRQWSQWQPGHHISIDMEHRCKDGRIIPVKISTGCIRQGNANLILAVVQDITERKRAEAERSRSQRETRRLAAEQATLAEIGRIISSTPEIEKIYDPFAAIAQKLVPFDSLSVNLVDLSQKTFRFAYNFGRDLFDERVGLEIPLTGSMTELAVRQQKALLFNASGVEEITRRFPSLTMVLSFHAGFLSNMLVPLLAQNAVIGVLHFRARRPNAFGEGEVSLAERIGTQIAGAIANAQLFEALRRAEENYRTLFREMLNGLALHEIICDGGGNPVDYRFLALNPAFERLTGLKAAEVAGRTVREVLPHIEPRWIETYGKVALTGEAIVFEDYSLELDKHFAVTAFRPAPNQFACIIADVTDRKQTEVEREATIRLLGILNSQDRLPSCMQEICRFLGDLLGVEAVGIRLQEGEDFPYIETRGLSDDFVTLETHLCRRDGDGQVERDEQGNPLLDCMCGNVIAGRFDPAQPFFTRQGSFWTNSTTELLATTTPAERQARTRNRCNGEGYESVALIPLRRGETTFGLIQLNDRRRGRFTPQVIARMERLADTVAISLAHRLTQRELQLKEQQLARIAETSPVCITQLDADGRIVFANLQAQQVLGLQRDEILGHTYNAPDWKITDFAGNPLAADRLPFRRVRETLQPLFDARHAIEWPNGARRYLSINAAPLFTEAGQFDGIVAAVSDMSDRKLAEEEREKLQEQLLQSQKMESVGRLAGGVAHDFNNMLGVILGHTEIALEQVEPGHPLRTDLLQIEKAAKRSADLTRQLLAFARKQTIAPRILDLGQSVEGTLAMLRRLIGEDIELAWTPGANLWPVMMDPSQINQILTNLCVNARDAIPGVGKITIATENVTVTAGDFADPTDAQPGDYVCLSVRDDGSGMDRETLGKLFEPFFTTKEIGKGTGLGLATIYGIVKQNSGFIHVTSEPGQGSTFRIYIPRHGGHAVGAPGETAAPNPPGRETVLIVEDEPTLLELARLMLTRQGYSVLAAATPDEALRLAQTAPAKIDLLMTDVVMPGMNGRDLAQRLLALHPGIRCLYASGYPADVIAHHGVLNEGTAFIQKPFSRRDLCEKIRAVLEQP